ncbi:MAG: S-layer homology domain-containing protein, partial [Clostridia bacterium]|nr:S-layer homology domain-containing protein [Clostridia bacterium]
TDITAGDAHIAKAAENGYVNGFGDGTFRPNNPITRQDFFTIVGRAYKLEGEVTSEFTDATSIADYAKTYVDALQSIGIVNGYGDGTVNPRGNITIAETLAVMHRTDEHVKANTPKEEEKKPTGSSGGGGGGSFNSSTQPSWSRKEADKLMSTVTYEIEYTDDWSSGAVAYVAVDVDTTTSMKLRKALAITGSFSTGFAGGAIDEWKELEKRNLIISEKNGRFAVPDFGHYQLALFDERDRYWDGCSIIITPPESDDVTPPEIAIEFPENTALPYEVKINATDDTQIARISACPPLVVHSIIGAGEDRNAQNFKRHVNGRQIITSDTFTVDRGCIVQAMDTAGNCSYVVLGGGVNSTNIRSSSEAAKDIPYMDGECIIQLSQGATFTIEREEDLSGQHVAHVKADIASGYGTIKKKLLLKDGDYIGDVDGPNNGSWEVAEKFGQYIAEEDGVFHIPDFDKYALYVQNDAGTWYKATFEVKPPESDDTTPPVLTIKAPQEAYLPTTVQVEAEDDAGIARISYVMPSVIRILRGRKNYDRFNVYVNGREILTGNDLTLDEGYRYAICAMDVNGNCSYAFVSVGGYSDENPDANLIQVEYGDEDTRPDRTAPMIEFYRYDSNLTLKAYFEDNKEVTEAGWFYMSEPYEMDSDEKQIKRAYILDGQTIDLSKNIEDLTEFDGEHGGLGSVCILKNYYDATQEINGVKITPISGKPWVPIINVQQNGAYFIYAKDSSGNISVLKVDVNKTKTASATFEVEHEEDASSEYVAHVTATVDPNPNAPIKQMFAVKSDYEPESAGAYREYTPNGKAQKIWDEVSESGEYIPVEESKFSVSEYGTYSLYMLDEYGNWGVAEVEVKEPETDATPEI